MPDIAGAAAPTRLAKAPAQKRGRREPARHGDEDAFFLPAKVLLERRGNPGHWANAAAGWRPPLEAPEAVQPLPLAAGDEEDLWAEKEAQVRQTLQARRHGAEQEEPEGTEEPLGPKDEPKAYELLSPEESEAKRDIWNEVNRDLLEYWALRAKQRRAQKQDLEKKRRLQERRWLAEQQREQQRWERQRQGQAERHARQLRARSRSGALGGAAAAEGEAGGPGAADAELDGTVLDFWQAHQAANEQPFAAPPSPVAAAAVMQEPSSASDVLAEAFRDPAREARVALQTALREEREERQKLRDFDEAKSLFDELLM